MIVTQSIHRVDLKEMIKLISVLTDKTEWKRKDGLFYLAGEINIGVSGDYVQITLFSKDYSQSFPDGFDIERKNSTA